MRREREKLRCFFLFLLSFLLSPPPPLSLSKPHLGVREQPRVLPHGVRRPLEPLLVRGRLRGSQHLDEAVAAEADAAADVVRPGEVAVERRGVELGHHVDLVDA